MQGPLLDTWKRTSSISAPPTIPGSRFAPPPTVATVSGGQPDHQQPPSTPNQSLSAPVQNMANRSDPALQAAAEAEAQMAKARVLAAGSPLTPGPVGAAAVGPWGLVPGANTAPSALSQPLNNMATGVPASYAEMLARGQIPDWRE